MLATGQYQQPTPGAYPQQQGQFRLDGLVLTVVEGKNIADTDLLGKADPYVIVKIGSEKKQTKVHSASGPNPQFNEKFDFDLRSGAAANATEVIVEMYDKDRFSVDDLLGKITIPISELARGGTIDRFFPLVDKHGKTTKGEIRLSMHPSGSFLGAVHDAVHGHGQSNPIAKLKQKLKGGNKHDDDSSSDSD